MGRESYNSGAYALYVTSGFTINPARCMTGTTCILCHLTKTSPMSPVPMDLVPGTMSHFKWRPSHTRRHLKEHLVHIGRGREFHSDTRLPELYELVYGVRAPLKQTDTSTPRTDMQVMLAVRNTDWKQNAWDAHVSKSKWPTYRLFMKGSSPWEDGTHISGWR